jgi:tricarballylate dehydrogenase
LTERFDVAVVGGGSAAFEAAVAARHAGAERVVLLEKAPEAEFGGNARFSHTGFRFCHSGKDEIRRFLPRVPVEEFDRMVFPPYTTDDFLRDLATTSRGRMDARLARVLAERSNAAAHWLLGSGLAFQPNKSVLVEGRLHFEPGAPLQAAGGMRGGLNQLHHWLRLAHDLGIDIRFEAPVTGLIGSTHRVSGVRVEGGDGSYSVEAGATILCAGGFQANAALRRRFLGPAAVDAKVKGSRHDTGEVLLMALDLGAARSGGWAEGNYVPTDPTCPPVESSNSGNRFSYAYGITVNREGRRFIDEGANFRSHTLQWMGAAILEQPGGTAYQLFDQQGVALLQRERYDEAVPALGETIEGLAEAIGIDPDRLRRTVTEFNDSVHLDVPFDPATLDGRSTSGITPPKSNWATAITEPPFVAYEVTAGILFSYGGLLIDEGARVLGTDGAPIPGLYASGDILGLFHGGDPSGTGQTRNAVFSRLAGAGAAAAASEIGRSSSRVLGARD